MQAQKKPIPVKYFYMGMLITAAFIASVFVFLWQKESNEEKLLKEKGIVTTAWITSLYSSKVSKKSNPNYFMEVMFFHDTSSNKNASTTEAGISVNTGDSIVAEMAKNVAQLHAPLGKLETQKIVIPTYEIYKRYRINDTVKIVFLNENPSIIRLVTK